MTIKGFLHHFFCQKWTFLNKIVQKWTFLNNFVQNYFNFPPHLSSLFLILNLPQPSHHPFPTQNSQSFLWAFPVRPKDSPLHPLLLPLPFQAQPNLPPIYTSPKTSFPHPLFPLPSSSSPLSWSPPNRQNPTSDTIHIYSRICEYMWIVSLPSHPLIWENPIGGGGKIKNEDF